MHPTSRLFPLMALLALAACGSGGIAVSAGGAAPGPTELALPVFADGTSKTLALRNVADAAATVDVAAVPGGALLGSPFTVPALGELRLAVGLPEGWLTVATSGATTGLVEPYLLTERSGPDEEATPGAVYATTQSAIPIHRLTNGVLFLNRSEDGGVPTAADFVFTFYSTSGAATVLFGGLPLTVGADTSLLLPILPEPVGHLSVEPAPFPQTAAPTTTFAFTLATHDDNDIVLDVDDQGRLLDAGAASTADLILDFGRDADGNYHDFDIVASNATDAPSSFTIQSIHDSAGAPIKVTPRTVSLDPRATRLYASNLTDSVGLVNPEVHPFADLFGDVFASGGLTRFRMALSISEGTFLTARQFDPLALDYAMRVRPMARRRALSALVSEAQTTTAGGILNVVRISNSTAGSMTVNVRAFTQDLGTEYVLPSVVVGPRAMLDWSADALGLREIVGDTAGPEVRNLRIVLLSNLPFGARAFQKTRNGADLLVMLRPHIVRQDD